MQVQTNTIDLKSALMLLALALVWGGSFFFAEIALQEVPPLTIALHRVFWAVLVLLAVVLYQRIKFPTATKTWLCYLVMGALNNAIPFSLIFWGQTHIGSGLASILNSTTAFFGILVASVFLVNESLTKHKLIGALFGMCGVAAIIGFDSIAHFDLKNLSQLAILGAALSYALAGVWGKLFLADNPPIMNALGMLMGSLVWLVPLAMYFDGVPTLSLSSSVWASLFAIAVLSTSIAYILYFKILVRAGSANLMLVTLLIPPFAIALSVIFLDEKLTEQTWLGFALIAVGLIINDGRGVKWLFTKRV